ncbi:hypothetical protein RI138_10570 [Streptomyces sp. C11-1]|uniref:CU044_5270 family protein n=1 Tax=Streptomyces durocortorensis TaxID=2811104 RepID=A0ABY9VTK7_9ACTN|nr:hypothetical protein [Streptomyces durocortorensis]WNF27245.1 hypothetical protein RI138_10570 [Streptomyces durocortorensis]
MDEIGEVRRFRAEIPEFDDARLAPIHRRMRAEIAGARPRRIAACSRGRFSMVGAVASVVAVAVLSTLVLRHEDTPPAAPEPRSQPWVYQEVRWDTWQCGTGASTDGYSEVGSFNLSPASRTCRAVPAAQQRKDKWIRYDGSALATPDESTSRPDDVDVWEGNYQAGWQMLSPGGAHDLVAQLPVDPSAALNLIRARSAPTRFAGALRLTQDQRDFAEVVGVLSAAPDVPEHKARTLYDVIRKLAGATEPVQVTDGVGRNVLAVGVNGTYRDNSDERNSMQVLLDPDSFAYRGVRYVAGLDYYVGGKSSGGPFVPKGTVLATATRASTALVDRAGERP